MSKLKPAFTLFFSLLIPLFANLISPLFSFAENETEETLTITTYYPAPFGVYNEMRSKRMAVGDSYINGSTFSWDAGTIDANADLVVEGNVGIGTVSPQAKLDVAGGVKIANVAGACSSTVGGTVRYNSASGAMEYCKGTTSTWTPLGGGSSNVRWCAPNDYCVGTGGTVLLCMSSGDENNFPFIALGPGWQYGYWSFNGLPCSAGILVRE